MQQPVRGLVLHVPVHRGDDVRELRRRANRCCRRSRASATSEAQLLAAMVLGFELSLARGSSAAVATPSSGAADLLASKYAGCNGGGAGCSPAPAVFFLRRCKRSRIHLRMFRLVTQIGGTGAIGIRTIHDRRGSRGTDLWPAPFTMISYAEPNSFRRLQGQNISHSPLSEDRRCSCHSRLVRRRRRQALCDDASKWAKQNASATIRR